MNYLLAVFQSTAEIELELDRFAQGCLRMQVIVRFADVGEEVRSGLQQIQVVCAVIISQVSCYRGQAIEMYAYSS